MPYEVSGKCGVCILYIALAQMSDSVTNYSCSGRTIRRRKKASVEEHLRSVAVISSQISTERPDTVTHSSMEVQELNEMVMPEVFSSADQAEVFSDDTGVDYESVPPLDDEISSDYMWNESDVSDSFDDSEDESDSNCVRARIAAWATTFNISQLALAALLSILRQSGLDLPKDPRTLRGTPRNAADIKHIAGGSYHHFGIVNSLCCKLQNMKYTSLIRTLTLNINIDGLPLFRSSNMHLWPILAMVQEFGKMEPLVIGIFCGPSKPTSIREF